MFCNVQHIAWRCARMMCPCAAGAGDASVADADTPDSYPRLENGSASC